MDEVKKVAVKLEAEAPVVRAEKEFIEQGEVQERLYAPNEQVELPPNQSTDSEEPFLSLYTGAGWLGELVLIEGFEWKLTSHLSFSFDLCLPMDAYFNGEWTINFQGNYYPFSKGWKIGLGTAYVFSSTQNWFPIVITGWKWDFTDQFYLEAYLGLKPPVIGTVLGYKL